MLNLHKKHIQCNNTTYLREVGPRLCTIDSGPMAIFGIHCTIGQSRGATCSYKNVDIGLSIDLQIMKTEFRIVTKHWYWSGSRSVNIVGPTSRT